MRIEKKRPSNRNLTSRKNNGASRCILHAFVIGILLGYFAWEKEYFKSLGEGAPILVLHVPGLSTISSSSADATDDESISFLKTTGNNWNIWKTGMKPLFADRQEFGCDWVPYGPQTEVNEANNGTATINMCVHPEHDLLSNTIREKGNWGDCQSVAKQWPPSTSSTNHSDTAGSFHIEIGANIGACVMELLLTTNANIVRSNRIPRTCFASRRHWRRPVRNLPSVSRYFL
jgi:hypothetical protein